jgi:hypothetical protein
MIGLSLMRQARRLRAGDARSRVGETPRVIWNVSLFQWNEASKKAGFTGIRTRGSPDQ